ncbi:glycoside hydrolase family 16 protein [Boletus coccyginus]|nr:glycoside hydrolase family 16 protein [Boletus coccyginus]
MGLQMHALLVALFAAIPLRILAGAQGIAPRSRDMVARPSHAKTYVIQDWYQGLAFFLEWSFFTSPDPTNGNVNYLSEQDATSQQLAYVNTDNTLVLAVDSTSTVPAGGNRNSVRIMSNKAYTGGLFILDALAMPSFGPNWPTAGEIDIVEGINNQANNQMTLHSGTSHPCTLNVTSTTANAGCSILDTSMYSFGYGFNTVQGGVFALLWDTSAGMHFARDDIPEDITNKAPTPANWGTPAGWAGAAYGNSGCPGTCSDMVANATNFTPNG